MLVFSATVRCNEGTDDKQNYIITMLSVENVYVEVNVCNVVILPSH